MNSKMAMSYDRFYINGEWVLPNANAQTQVINPATEELIGVVPQGNAVDVERAVQAARKAFPGWSKTTASQRAAYITALANEMKVRQEELSLTISRELGMPLHLALDIQVLGPIEGVESYIDVAHELAETQQIGNSVIYKEPVGVCSLICPWNYPLHQLVGKIAPALAAGCTMVVKPACETPINAFLLAEILESIDLPPGVFNLVTGPGPTVGEAMCIHPEVDLVSFTGSTQAGVRIAKIAGESVKRVCQELGGKSPLIITQDADLETAVKYGVEDVMLNSGQTCTALTRMLVPYSCYEQAVAHAKHVAEGLTIGDPLDGQHFMGSMSSAKQQASVLHYIQQGIDEGATLITGGLAMPEGVTRGFYVRPTIFAHVCNHMVIAQEEIFGPVLCIIPYEDIKEAIDIANDTVFGLSAAVWSGTKKEGLDIAREIRAGQVFVNGGEYNYLAPFGGFKQSGNGREWGLEGAMEYIELKSIQL